MTSVSHEAKSRTAQSILAKLGRLLLLDPDQR
jgi:hypothetical protein